MCLFRNKIQTIITNNRPCIIIQNVILQYRQGFLLRLIQKQLIKINFSMNWTNRTKQFFIDVKPYGMCRVYILLHNPWFILKYITRVPNLLNTGRVTTRHLLIITNNSICFFSYVTVNVWLFSIHYVPNKYLPIQAVYYLSILPMYFSSYACIHFQSDKLLVKVY